MSMTELAAALTRTDVVVMLIAGGLAILFFTVLQVVPRRSMRKRRTAQFDALTRRKRTPVTTWTAKRRARWPWWLLFHLSPYHRGYDAGYEQAVRNLDAGKST